MIVIFLRMGRGKEVVGSGPDQSDHSLSDHFGCRKVRRERERLKGSWGGSQGSGHLEGCDHKSEFYRKCRGSPLELERDMMGLALIKDSSGCFEGNWRRVKKWYQGG